MTSTSRRRRAFRRWYARTVLRPLGHLNPRDFHRCDGLYLPEGPSHGPELRVAVIGDSTALGHGVDHPDQTPGALIGRGMAKETGRPVRVGVHAKFGATIQALAPQVDRALLDAPHLAVLTMGANDTLMPFPLGRAARRLRDHVRRLRAQGTTVVVLVGTDTGYGAAFPTLPRRLLSWRCRRLGRLQGRQALREGARIVSYQDPDFLRDQDLLIGKDRFHPSPEGYARQTGRVLNALLAASPPPTPSSRPITPRTAAREVIRTRDSYAVPLPHTPDRCTVTITPPRRTADSTDVTSVPAPPPPPAVRAVAETVVEQRDDLALVAAGRKRDAGGKCGADAPVHEDARGAADGVGRDGTGLGGAAVPRVAGAAGAGGRGAGHGQRRLPDR
ncbi:SGNH/GDSL hydrolase family protein [Streptomyces roseirectus]|uniref:SGNH/GDSL hydrolase family protein n=1 Tax=Streptomyces roseirectus TaxID=2768066 RepID=UPI001FE621BE|nr:SGNH/GDSL hydrolase family protein [Streptomyces roseirectus]